MMEAFKVNEDNKIIVKDYDAFNNEEMKLINTFNDLHVIDRSFNLHDLTNILRRKGYE